MMQTEMTDSAKARQRPVGVRLSPSSKFHNMSDKGSRLIAETQSERLKPF
jgi:hypothetical protein